MGRPKRSFCENSLRGQMSLKAFAPLAVLYTVKNYIDIDDPENLPYLRAFFYGTHSLAALIYAFIYFVIGKKNDETKLKVMKSDLEPPNPLAGLIEDPNKEPDAEIEMTHKEYDMKILMGALKQFGQS